MVRPDLLSDCARCAALCCIAPSFEACEDFAFDKPASVRCRYLTAAVRCAIHAERLTRGLSGCVVYECHGAGQRVTRAFASKPDAEASAARNAAFLRLRVLHELSWLLNAAAELCPVARTELHAELAAHCELLELRAQQALHDELDLRAEEAEARALLRRVGDALGGRRALRVLATG